jgi:hypothetical protein
MQNVLLHDLRGRTWLVIVVAAALGAALVLAAIQASGRSLDEQPESIAHAEELYHFDDMASMAATADIVIQGTVQAIQPGRMMGEGRGQLQVRALTVAVDEVLVSRMPSNPGSTITVEESGGWDSQGAGFMIEGMPWSEVGQSGYFYLTYLPPFKSYRVINSQGRVLDAGGRLNPSGSGKVADQVRAMTPPQLEEALARAQVDIQAGRLQPVPTVVEMNS